MAVKPERMSPADPDAIPLAFLGDDRPFSSDLANHLFLRLSGVFGVFQARSMDQRDRMNAEVLRRVASVGFFLGAIMLAGAATFANDQIAPVSGAWLASGAFFCFGLTCAVGRRLPSVVIRLLAFDVTIVTLFLIIALGNDSAYVALLYFGWPALTSAHFGRGHDFVRAMTLLAAGLPVALAFSEVPLPVLAYCGVIAVSVFSGIVIRAIVYQAIELFADLDRLASTDGLTGLLNRRSMTTALEEAVARAHRQRTDLAVVIFDLDHFKRINDSLGHPAGDAALKRFSAVLLDTCSSTDVAGRLGGEEFLVLLLRSDESGARAFAERFSDALDYATANDPAPLSVSAGVAALDDHRLDADGLLVAADRALYAAKRSGRHRVVAANDAGVTPLAPPKVIL